jgi:uncharacterized protein YydD (DUF2326 family)
MIKTVSANHHTFKTVHFDEGLNIVLADRTKESTKKDSRNGLGKTTLIEIIHFCLGANTKKGKGLLVKELSGWEFSLELVLNGKRLEITRSVDYPREIILEGEFLSLSQYIETKNGITTCKIDKYLLGMGNILFGLSIEGEDSKYKPTFRSLVSYFIRRGKDAYSIPFEHYRKQQEWDIQVNNSFLLGLNWEIADEFQNLKDRKKGLNDFRKAINSGIVEEFVGSIGDLEAHKIRLKKQSEHEEQDLNTFKVHPEYKKIQSDANQLTTEIHQAVNQNTMDRSLLVLYEKNIKEEKPPESELIDHIYKEAGIVLPNITLRHLNDIKNFHNTILQNRKSFLSQEIEQLRRDIDDRESFIENKTVERSEIMEILKSHGALEEYTLLQRRHLDTVQQLNSITSIIENTRKLENEQSNIKIENEMIKQRARRDYDERQFIREKAVTLFNSFSEKLYNAPGKLIINLEETGYKFDVEIERSDSAGISNMKIFCFDMMLARIWKDKTSSPDFIIHDSTLYDGVDERQRALALETASEESKNHNFQYICTLNSDNLPWNEFSKGFDLNSFVKLRLTDENEDGCLFGFRY